MTRRNLLLCFDAFGTLFKPKRPVAQQYGEIARQCGIVDFSDAQLQSSLYSAVKDEMKQNPNYGRSSGLGATKWWTNVIHKTFTPLISKCHTLPQELAPKLLQRFASREGYEIESELVSSLKALKRQRYFDNVIIGVITNSDDRVPDVLASFGVNVSPLRYGTAFKAGAVSEQKFDIDFHCMSYDVGFEKPDKLIFKAAESLLAQIITIQDGKGEREALADVETWQKVYVGDEHAKDVIGAQNAGWTPILLDVDDQSTGIPRLEDYPNRSPDNLLDNNTVVRIRSIQSLARWLTEPDC